MTQDVLSAFGLQGDCVRIEPFGSGLIHHTWKITMTKEEYILQKINHRVFTEPEKIAHNLQIIGDHLKLNHPEYKFVAPVATVTDGNLVYQNNEGYYRLFPFVRHSHSKDVVESPEQAFEAARQFGRFTRMLSGMNAAKLETTIPFFHDLELRYNQFLQAIEYGNKERLAFSRQLVNDLLSQATIVTQYRSIKVNPDFKLRVTHHDTKISNVLFDKNDKGICVIDLDTVMAGYFISDVGDMLRTYLSPVSEEENDYGKIEVRKAFYKAVVEGYSSEMKDELTKTEKEHFFFAGQFIIYMQALRFLTDYLNNDVYYGAKYERQNLVRATNQWVLLKRLIEKKGLLKRCVVL